MIEEYYMKFQKVEPEDEVSEWTIGHIRAKNKDDQFILEEGDVISIPGLIKDSRVVLNFVKLDKPMAVDIYKVDGTINRVVTIDRYITNAVEWCAWMGDKSKLGSKSNIEKWATMFIGGVYCKFYTDEDVNAPS